MKFAPALVFALMLGGATPVGATVILPPSNPTTNLRPIPNFLASGTCQLTQTGAPCTNPCVRLREIGLNLRPAFPIFTNAPTCTAYVVRSLDQARAREGLVALTLPTNWYRLTPQEQLFVLTDLERTARGLPPYLGLNRALYAEAQSAAIRQVDPSMAPGFRVGRDRQHVDGIGATFATGYTTLEADFVWMYDDGWGGNRSTTANVACTSALAPGCWAHRDQLLGSDSPYNAGVGLRCTTCEMGTGFAVEHGDGNFTTLIELPAGRAPPMYFTWATNVVPFLPAT